MEHAYVRPKEQSTSILKRVVTIFVTVLGLIQTWTICFLLLAKRVELFPKVLLALEMV